MKTKKLILDGNTLTLEKIEFFLNENPEIQLSSDSIRNINSSRKLVEKWVDEGEVIYGVTTGFGEFSNVNISKKDLRTLQENLILSHAVGTGEILHPKFVKIMMLLRINALARGFSGIKLSTLQLLINMMKYNIIPVVWQRY